ncbi:hypothetical protein SGRIM119S_08550 [Streptomyces griseorubiginosus]
MEATASTLRPSMWNSSHQYTALATRKLRTSTRPKSNSYVPQSGCSARRQSPGSYRGSHSNRANAQSSLGKWAGTQSMITPMPARCRASTRNLKSSGEVPSREVGA